MKKLSIFLAILTLCSCEKAYEVISEEHFRDFTVQDTLVNKSGLLVLKVGDSVSDSYSRLLVKSGRRYLFGTDCELKNDSTVLSYGTAFVIDDQGEFRKNGIWVYTKFSTEGVFPFNSSVMEFSVDSIPKNWNGKRPTGEGIYFYENDSLKLFSAAQSEEKFKEKEKNGFYFIPNKGRFFDEIDLKELD